MKVYEYFCPRVDNSISAGLYFLGKNIHFLQKALGKLWHTPLGKYKDRATARQQIYSECAFWMKDLAGIKSLPSAKVFQWNPGSESKGLSGFRSHITSISNTARKTAQTPGRLTPHRTQTNSFWFSFYPTPLRVIRNLDELSTWILVRNETVLSKKPTQELVMQQLNCEKDQLL